MDKGRRERIEACVKNLQEMRNTMLESENWENLKGYIDAVTYGGMALQRIIRDEEAFDEMYTEIVANVDDEDMFSLGEMKTIKRVMNVIHGRKTNDEN